MLLPTGSRQVESTSNTPLLERLRDLLELWISYRLSETDGALVRTRAHGLAQPGEVPFGAEALAAEELVHDQSHRLAWNHEQESPS